MKIAVCDDDKKDLAIIQDFIRTYDAGLQCDVFHSAVDLLNAHKKEAYDLMFLDIEMKPLSGFEAAKKLSADVDKPLIIFVTNSSKYTIQGYEVAFRYVVKPAAYDQIEQVLNAALEKIVPKKMLVEVNGRSQMISTRDIYYFEVFDHNVRICTQYNVYDCRDSLKNIEEMLSGGNFIRPHNSFLINLEHVVSASQTEFIMRDKHVISISRKKKDEVFKALHQYMRR